MAPVYHALRQLPAHFATQVCVTAQHWQMLDQVLDVYGIVPDIDFDLMTQEQVVVNAIEMDGTMRGYDLDLTKRMRGAVNFPVSFVGGAGSMGYMQALNDAFGVVGAAAGSLFVFKGPYRAVLIEYVWPARLALILAAAMRWTPLVLSKKIISWLRRWA